MDGKKELDNGQLAREMLLSSWSGRIKNVTFEEKKKLESYFQTGKAENRLVLSPEKIVIDPIFFDRVRRAVEKYGDVVLDIINDIYFGVPEDGLNEPIDEDFKSSFLKE